MKPTGMPRVRGRVGEVMVGPGASDWERAQVGKWSWQILIYFIDDKGAEEIWKTIDGFFLEKPFIYENKHLAQLGLKAEVITIVKMIQSAAGDPDPDGAYFDLKNGGFFRPDDKKQN